MSLVRLTAPPTGPTDAPLWQSPAWAAFQQALGREVRWYGDQAAAPRIWALVIIDRTVGGYATWDLPRGPIFGEKTTVKDAETFLELLAAEAKQDRAVSLFWSGVDECLIALRLGQPSSRHEQPEATIVLDLGLTDDALLAQMHQKGRYNIRLAEKHGVRVEQSADIGAYARLAKQTSARDGFRAPSPRQFELFLRTIPGSFLLLAFAPGLETPIAGLIGVTGGSTGIYYYGASSDAHRNLMAPYLLQWEAMRLCRRLGCRRYDLLGVAPPTAAKNHPWQGISDFKRKFGGQTVVFAQERELRLRPLIRAGLRFKRSILG